MVAFGYGLFMKPGTALKIISGVVLVAGCAVAGIVYTHQPSEPEVQPENGIFSGVVANGKTGVPLAQAHISITNLDSPRDKSDAICDENGKFHLELPEGRYQLTPTFAGYVPYHLYDQGREISVARGTHYVNARLTLWPQAKIAGRIVSGNAGLNADISLTLFEEDQTEPHHDTITTDENGNFIFSGLT